MKYTYSELVLNLDLREEEKKGVSFWDTCQPCLNGNTEKFTIMATIFN